MHSKTNFSTHFPIKGLHHSPIDRIRSGKLRQGDREHDHTPPEESYVTNLSSGSQEENSDSAAEYEDEMAVVPVPSPLDPDVITSDSSTSSSGEEFDSDDRLSNLSWYTISSV